MAVVKANFVKRGKGERSRAKASIRYIQCRRDKDGRTITRQLFGSDGPMERHEAYRMIDEAGKGTRFYRFVLSPDPKTEDTKQDLDFRDLTFETMRALDARAGEPVLWVASIHADHAPHRHVHVIALLPKQLRVQDFAHLRKTATRTCLEQRLMLEAGRIRARERPYRAPTGAASHLRQRAHVPWRLPLDRYRSARPLRTCTCPRCDAVHLHTARAPAHPCSSCGLSLHRGREPALSLRKEAGWGR